MAPAAPLPRGRRRRRLHRMAILFRGDRHGEFRFLLDSCERHRPEAVVLLGDMTLAAPLRDALAPVFEAATAARHVGGNWDCHSEGWHDRLLLSRPTGDLQAACRAVGGLEVGGLGGVFLDGVWLPRSGGKKPRFRMREEMLWGVPALSAEVAAARELGGRLRPP